MNLLHINNQCTYGKPSRTHKKQNREVNKNKSFVVDREAFKKYSRKDLLLNTWEERVNHSNKIKFLTGFTLCIMCFRSERENIDSLLESMYYEE